MGLHFPGTDIYVTGSHAQADVFIWITTYTFIYTVIPLYWLKKRGFSLRKLFSSFKWIRDLWIIIVYWAIDFFGPIFAGSTDFFGGIYSTQYAQVITHSNVINSYLAGLPDEDKNHMKRTYMQSTLVLSLIHI